MEFGIPIWNFEPIAVDVVHNRSRLLKTQLGPCGDPHGAALGAALGAARGCTR